jgi:AcrR family transcriptional regulator
MSTGTSNASPAEPNKSTSIFTLPTALPRGPHSLTREQVAESQRIRLMAAFTELLAERGYGSVRIGELASRAGVSRAAFYAHFASKEACLLAAYDHFAARVGAAISQRIDDAAHWSQFVASTLDGYLQVLRDDLVSARAFIVEMDAAGEIARQRRRDALRAFSALLAERHRQIRAQDPSLGPLPAAAYLALAYGVRELVHDALLNEDGGDSLAEVSAAVVVFATAVVEGAAAAQP